MVRCADGERAPLRGSRGRVFGRERRQTRACGAARLVGGGDRGGSAVVSPRDPRKTTQKRKERARAPSSRRACKKAGVVMDGIADDDLLGNLYPTAASLEM